MCENVWKSKESVGQIMEKYGKVRKKQENVGQIVKELWKNNENVGKRQKTQETRRKK